MPGSLNRVILLGNLGRDAEVKHTPNGTSVANFTLATERRWKDKNSGEWKSETDWHRIVAWRVDGVAPFLLKGKAVLVEGRLQTRSYEDKSGEKRYVTEVVADNLVLAGARDASSGESQPRGCGTAAREVSRDPRDEEMPF